MNFVEKKSASARTARAASSSASVQELAELTRDPSARVRREVASHPNASLELLRLLVADTDWQVRERVAMADLAGLDPRELGIRPVRPGPLLASHEHLHRPRHPSSDRRRR